MPQLYPLLALTTSFFITAPAHADNTFALSSTSFIDRQDIPALYTCDGRDISPALHWQDVPANTQSLVLICEDPDAPLGTWYHWVLYNIPKNVTNIAAGQTPSGATTGQNSWGRVQYNGPCPPSRTIHHYVFNLYALDTVLSLPPGVDGKTLEKAMQGHVLEKTSILGVFGH